MFIATTALKKSKIINLLCIAMMMIGICLKAQAPEQQHLAQLNRFPGNKLLLLGKWTATERAVWNVLLDSEGIFEFDIKILETSGDEMQSAFSRTDSSEFDRWLSAKYVLRGSRWLVLDSFNQAIAHDAKLLAKDEFISRLESAGLKNPVKLLRDFLRIYPNHLEAKTDLLKQLRRRAIKLQSTYRDKNEGNKQLDPEADLLTWASLAQAVDDLFKGNWQGIEIPFFRAEEEDQPEQYSSTMKAVFARHIAKVEAALQVSPNIQSLWDVWAWMARSMENRDWKKFLLSLDAFTYTGSLHCPAPNVAVWLLKEAKAIGDWENVVELGKIGRNRWSYHGEEETIWIPGGWGMSSRRMPLEGYPIDTSFIPMLEGLLKLDRVEEANTIFEDILLLEGEAKREIMLKLAQSSGQSSLVQAWQTKVLDNSIPRLGGLWNAGGPTIIGFGIVWRGPIQFSKIHFQFVGREDANKLGWPKDGKRWALLDDNNRLVIEGEDELKEEPIFEALAKIGYKTPGELARMYLREHPSNTYAQYVLASELSIDAVLKMSQLDMDDNETLSDDLDYDLYSECAKIWRTYYENELVLNSQIQASNRLYQTTNSNLMREVAKVVLPRLETALQQQPMSDYLWGTWSTWRKIGGNTRSFASLLENLVPSPLVASGTFPPAKVMHDYYTECVAQERWADAAKLLLQPWERELARIDAINLNKGADFSYSIPLAQAWRIGKLLITALLKDGRIYEAEDVVEAWTSRGGKFENATDIIELAKKLEYMSLAVKWERLAEKNSDKSAGRVA
ncbi:MAG: hypothetical protein FWG02_01450 [Holophagaceae bacterium]|nr:hypothetical protein [Holophagaceae bacterium]